MNRIKGLDGLRALAVIMVIMSHVVIWPRIGVENQQIIDVFDASVGVNIFFVLTGFLATLSLLREEQQKGKINGWNFFIRRALRVLPLYFFVVLLVFFMDYYGSANVNSCVYPNAFTHTLNFFSRECNFSSFSHLWVLAVDFHFYFFWAIVFCFGRRFALLIAALTASACLYFSTSLYPLSGDYYFNRWTFPAVLPIMVGCIVAFFVDGRLVKRLLCDKSSSPILLVAILAGLAAPAFYKSDLIWLVSISGLVMYVYHNQESILVSLLDIRPFVVLGVISYGVYVWHGVLTGNGPYRESSFVFPPEMDAGLWLTFIVAPLSYFLLERPIMKLKNRFR